MLKKLPKTDPSPVIILLYEGYQYIGRSLWDSGPNCAILYVVQLRMRLGVYKRKH